MVKRGDVMHIFFIVVGFLLILLFEYCMYKKHQLSRRIQYIRNKEKRYDQRIERLNYKLDRLHQQMNDEKQFMDLMNQVSLKIKNYWK